MKEERINFIVNQARENSLDGISEDAIRDMILSTERQLGRELTGYAVFDKPYNQFYSTEMLTSEYPKQKISTEILLRAEKIPDVVAYRCERDFYYGELSELMLKYAFILKEKYHVGKGDVIIMDSLSTPDAICSFWACNLVGAKVRPIDPIYSADQVEKILIDYKPKMVICDALHFGTMSKAIGEKNIPVGYIKLRGNLPLVSPVKKSIVLLLEDVNELQIRRDKNSLWSNLHDEVNSVDLSSIRLEDLASPYVEDEIAAIFPTSGTTGEAKGVEVTNENFLSNVFKEYISDFDIEDNDSLFNPMPTCSSFFWYTIALASFLGVTTSLCPMFDAKVSVKQIAEDESTWVLLGPIIVEQLCRYIEKNETSNPIFLNFICSIERALFGKDSKEIVDIIKGKRHYISGGDLLPLKLERRAKSHSLFINNNLGTSENTGPSTNPNGARKNLVGYYEGCVGVSLPGNDMAIFKYDEENNCPALDADDYDSGQMYYEVGEICFKASNPNVFAGYFNNPEATAQTILTHSDGSVWYHSGDLGYMDPAGHCFCCGRKSGLIVRDGHKVWAPKIEIVAKNIAGIDDCAVIGVPDAKENEVPACFIVFSDGVNPQQKNAIVREFYSNVLSSIDEKHVPTYWKELDAIPRNLMAKAKIPELNEIYEDDISQRDGEQGKSKNPFKILLRTFKVAK